MEGKTVLGVRCYLIRDIDMATLAIEYIRACIAAGGTESTCKIEYLHDTSGRD